MWWLLGIAFGVALIATPFAVALDSTEFAASWSVQADGAAAGDLVRLALVPQPMPAMTQWALVAAIAVAGVVLLAVLARVLRGAGE